ncbi:MAG TPA: hypothetical protein DCS67_04070 [Clostridiales bacterium UBA8960]|jgi:uncharacterized integral membrane protein|nr:hypothetical protein [Clostridiales bacterium UBA8960]
MQTNIVLVLVFAIIVTLFAIFNASVVTVSLFFVDIEVSLALVIIVAALVGAIVVILLDSVKKIKHSMHVKELQKKIVELEKKVVDFEKQVAAKDETISNQRIIIENYQNTKIETVSE